MNFPLKRYLDCVIPSPAIPLAIYFCVSTMLAIVVPYLGIAHPAYWIFGYLAICVVRQLMNARLQISGVDLVFLAFVAVILLSWMTSGYTGGSRTISLLLTSAVIPWAAVRVFHEADVTRFLQCIALFGSVTCILIILAIPFMPATDEWERMTFLGGAAYGNIGPTIGLLAVMSGTYLMRENMKAAWIALTASVIAIVHMGGRGMLASMFLTFLLGCLVINSDWKRKASVLGVVFVAVAIGLVEIPKARWDHFLRLGFRVETPLRSVDDTIGERLELYRAAGKLFLANPLTGVGAGRFGLETWLNEELTTPHSTVFHILSELGLLGAVPFVALNLVLLFLAYRARTTTLSCVVAAVWIYFAVFDQISANYLSSLRYYLFSALLLALSLKRTDLSQLPRAHLLVWPLRQVTQK